MEEKLQPLYFRNNYKMYLVKLVFQIQIQPWTISFQFKDCEKNNQSQSTVKTMNTFENAYGSIFLVYILISYKRTKRYEYYEWTGRYYEWTDEYYEWIDEYYEWTDKGETSTTSWQTSTMREKTSTMSGLTSTTSTMNSQASNTSN